MVKFYMERKRRAALLLAVVMIGILCLTACKDKNPQTQSDPTQTAQGQTDQSQGNQIQGNQNQGNQTQGDSSQNDQTQSDQGQGGHTHTYAAQFSCDTDNHWRSATCEHTGEVRDFGAHQFADNRCQICGYQNGKLLVKTNNENQKYIRTEPIHTMLKLGLMYDENTNVKWVQAQADNIESYVVGNKEIGVTVSAVVNNLKYTEDIIIPLDGSPVDVESFFAQNAGNTCMLRGVVAGFSTSAAVNEVVLADKQTGRLVSVTKMGEGKLLYGGYSLPGVEIGDEIIVPVAMVKEKQSSTANSARIYAEYKGGTEYGAAVVSKNNPIKYPGDRVLIDSQADLQAFLAAGKRENNHYKIVTFKGKMNFVMDSTYENHNFWFSEKSVSSSKDLKIDNIIPSFNDPAISYTTGLSFSNLVFGKSHQAAIDYKKPLSAEVEITAVFMGGGTTYGQFLILDRSWVTK